MNIEESRDKMLEAIAEHEQMCQAYFQSILQQTGLSEKVIQIWTGKVGILKPVQGKFLPAEEPVEIRFFSEEEQKAESVQESTKIKPLSKQIAQEYDMGLTWVANPVSLEMFGLDKDRKENRAFRGIVQKNLSKIEEKNYVFDGIFLCRSDIWTPPHLDNAFCSLCDVITDHFNYVMMEKDIRKCRDCETIVQQLKPDFDRASRKQVQ